MNRKVWQYAMVLVIVLAGSVSITHANTATQETAAITVTPLADILGDVASETGIPSAALSPDGTRIAWYERHSPDEGIDGRLCLFALADSETDCHPHDSEGQISGLNWSPDSRYIVFNEEFARYFLEPDIWVFDTITGEVSNFTEDGVDEGGFMFDAGAKADAKIDLLPVWNPVQPNQLYFFRMIATEEPTLAVYSLQVDTGTVALVRDLENTFPMLSVFNIGTARGQVLDGRATISPDGRQLAFIVVSADLDDLQNGVWLLDLTGEAPPSALFSMLDTQPGMPEWADMHVRSATGLAWWPGTSKLLVAAQGPASVGDVLSNIWFVDTAVNDVEPLVDFSGIASEAYAQLDEMGFATISYSTSMPVLVGDTLLTLAYNRRAPGVGSTIIRRYRDLADSKASDVIYEFSEDSRSINMQTISVSADGKTILDGYLIDLSG